MEFKIINTEYEMKECHKKVIEKYNGEQIRWYESDERDVYKIDFTGISDLVMFQAEINEEIIFFSGDNYIEGEVLEIYDDWRE